MYGYGYFSSIKKFFWIGGFSKQETSECEAKKLQLFQQIIKNKRP